MRDDRLFLFIDNRFAPAHLDFNYTTKDRAFAPQVMRLEDFSAAVIKEHKRLGQTLFADLSECSLDETQRVVQEAVKLQEMSDKPTRVILIVKAVTTHPAWVTIIKECKDIIFLQGKIQGSAGSVPLAVVVFWGEIKGCPMVYAQNVDALEDMGSFSRQQLLFSRHTQK